MKNKRPYWFTGLFGTIGIVTGEDDVTGKKKAYIGTASGFDEDADTQHIAKTGSPVDPRQLAEILGDLKDSLNAKEVKRIAIEKS